MKQPKNSKRISLHPSFPTLLHWWERDDLKYIDGTLHLSGKNLEQFVQSAGTVPCFVYSFDRIKSNLQRLEKALKKEELSHRFFFAIKANRNPAMLAALRLSNLCGADVCSPGELLLARQSGFEESEISYTGTSVDDADIEVLTRHPDVFVNCDSISQLQRLGRACPGREIGIRINPAAGIGMIHYGGIKPTKFGIYKDSFVKALAIAKDAGLKVVGLHWHLGWGMTQDDFGSLEELFKQCRWFVDQMPGLKRINLGGGLGVPMNPNQQVLNLTKWAALVAKYFNKDNDIDENNCMEKVAFCFEPGTYIAMDAGVLIMRVNTIEQKGGIPFAFVNGGLNLDPSPAYYHIGKEIVPLRQFRRLEQTSRNDKKQQKKFTVAGNINEAMDILAEGIPLEGIAEGEYIVMLNTGAYGSSMSSNHCMRGNFMEYVIL